MANQLSSTKRGYGAAYRRARRHLLASNPACHWCGAPATQADHEPPIAVVGKPHLNLVPACADCNLGRKGRSAPHQPEPSRDW